MLTIRLQRTGKKKQPQFRIVLAEKHKHPSKKFLEILGTYNPRSKDFTIKDEKRVKYWMSQNVELTPTIHNLFVEQGIIDGEKVQAWKPKKKKDEKKEEAEGGEEKPAEEGKQEEKEGTEKEAGEAAEESEDEQPEESAEEKSEEKEEQPEEDKKEDVKDGNEEAKEEGEKEEEEAKKEE